jgi:hypothetical protein
MSRSNKARYSTRTKRRKQRTSGHYKGGWKDSIGKSRSQVRSRSKWKKVTKKSPKKTLRSRKPQKPVPVPFEDFDPYEPQDEIPFPPPRPPLEYEDPTGLYPPMRMAVITGRPPTDFKLKKVAVACDRYGREIPGLTYEPMPWEYSP